MTGTVAQVVGPHVVTRPGPPLIWPTSCWAADDGPYCPMSLAPDCVGSPDGGTFHGHDGLRTLARMLAAEPATGGWDYRVRLVEGNAACLEWGVDAGDAVVDDGADSFSSSTGESSSDPPESGTDMSDARTREPMVASGTGDCAER